MKYALLILSTLFIMNSCLVGKSKKDITKIQTDTEAIAKNNFDSDYKITYNKTYDFAAISKNIKLNSIDDFNTLKVMVFDTKNNKVLWGRKAAKGKLEWTSKYELQIIYLNKEKSKSTLIYNVKTKEISYL